MSLVRFAMFAERAIGVLSEARAVQAAPVSGLDTDALRDLLKAKETAGQDIATFEPLLYPAD